MKVVLLCGGRGIIDPYSRNRIPKAMAMIGNRPVLWYVMKIFSTFGHKDFILALGEGGDEIRHYFFNYNSNSRDSEVTLSSGGIEYLSNVPEEDWKVKLVDTGLDAQTGSRLARCQRYLDDQSFLLSYSDCLCNVNLNDLVALHQANNKILTVTGVQPPSRFGTFFVQDGEVSGYSLKSVLVGKGGYINGGFMMIQPDIFQFVQPFTECNLEQEVFSSLTEHKQVTVYPHDGYWQAVDTERDLSMLNQLYRSNQRPWLPHPVDF